MKIGILSTPWISVPPLGYGGIELVVHNLTEGLVRRGHDVTLYATGDSHTKSHLEFTYKKALGNDGTMKSSTPYSYLNHVHNFFDVVRKNQFDILHNNGQYLPMYFFDLQNTPFVHTLHGAYYENISLASGNITQIRDTLHMFRYHPFISISFNQRQGMADLNYVNNIYNGIKMDDFALGSGKGNYLAWLGRITPNKGVDIAIRVANKAGIPLKIAAYIDPIDRDYYESQIKPHIKGDIQMIGQLNSNQEKSQFLGNAMATLMPIVWPEPFGLVMVESLACGTPVIAFNKGATPEIIKHTKTGYIVDSEPEMIESIQNIRAISRRQCKEDVSIKFNIDTMVESYISTYKSLLECHD